MNDTTIVLLLGVVASLIAILAPIIRLTSSITEIKAILKRFETEYRDAHNRTERRLNKHSAEIDELKDITTKQEVRIDNLEKGE